MLDCKIIEKTWEFKNSGCLIWGQRNYTEIKLQTWVQMALLRENNILPGTQLRIQIITAEENSRYFGEALVRKTIPINWRMSN